LRRARAGRETAARSALAAAGIPAQATRRVAMPALGDVREGDAGVVAVRPLDTRRQEAYI
jgi:hypothetical protein